MISKSDPSSWNDAWASFSGGKQEERMRTQTSGTSNSAARRGQPEATGAEYFFGKQYSFSPDEAPRESHTVATNETSEHTNRTHVVELRSNAEQSITPGRRKGERRKGNRCREGEGKRGQKDRDFNKKQWYQYHSKNEDIQGQSNRKQPQNGDELLGNKERLQSGEERNRPQVQKQNEDTQESSNFLNFLFDKGNDGMRDHAPNDTARVTNQSAEENDGNPTKGRDSAGDISLPFLNYFWRIEPLEESPSTPSLSSAAILEARDEGIQPGKSSLLEEDEAPLRVHRRKRWFSITHKQGDFGSSLDPKTDQSRNNDNKGLRFEEEDVSGRELGQDYGLSMEVSPEEDYSKSRNCMSFRRNLEARGSGIFSGRVLAKSSLHPDMDQGGKDDTQGSWFEEDEDVSSRKFDVDTGLSVDDAREEGNYSKSRNCMSLRRNLEARGNGIFSGRVLSKSSLHPGMDQGGNNDTRRPRFEEDEDVSGRKFDLDTGLSVDDAREEGDYSKSRNCMSLRRNLEARGDGIFSGRVLDGSRREMTSRRDTLTIEEEEQRVAVRDASRQKDMSGPEQNRTLQGNERLSSSSPATELRKEKQLVTAVRYDGREGSRDESLQHGPNKSREGDDDNERAPRAESRQRGKHERAARRNWLARHSTSEQDYGTSVDDAVEEVDYSEPRSCMSFRRNPGSRGSGIFSSRVLDESRRELTSRRDTPPLEEEEEEEEEQHVAVRDASRLQDVSRREQDRTLQRTEQLSSSLPKTELTSHAKKTILPAKGRQSVPTLQARRAVEERVRPQSPKGASLWRGEMWGLLSLSVDSLDAEEPARYATRTSIRINRSTSKKKAPVDGTSMRAASWDSYSDEDSYSSASSVFSLESLEALSR